MERSDDSPDGIFVPSPELERGLLPQPDDFDSVVEYERWRRAFEAQLQTPPAPEDLS